MRKATAKVGCGNQVRARSVPQASKHEEMLRQTPLTSFRFPHAYYYGNEGAKVVKIFEEGENMLDRG
jgi:hypothetical protein